MTKCASDERARHNARVAEEKVAGADLPRDQGREAFAQKGVDAPTTVIAPEQDAAPLDLAEMSIAVGEAQEATPEMLDHLRSRGERRRVAITSLPPRAQVMRESGASDEGGSKRSDARGRRRTSEGGFFAGSEPQSKSKTHAPGEAGGSVTGTESTRAPSTPVPSPKPAEASSGAPPPPPDTDDLSVRGHVSQAVKIPAPAKARPGGIEPELLKDGKADKKKEAEKTERKPTTLLPAVARAPKLGQILISGEGGHKEALKPRAIRVVAYVEGPRARTVIDYVFENPYGQRLEGMFHHPLPADGSPAGFAMFDGTKKVSGEEMFQSTELLPELGKSMIDPFSIADVAPSRSKNARAIDWGERKDARVVEQKRAREVYEELVRRGIDPGASEWSGHEFQARVFPLEPHSLKRIVVAFEQPLLFDGRRFRYDYVLPDDPALKEHRAIAFVDENAGAIAEKPEPSSSMKVGHWMRFDLEKPKGGSIVGVAVEPKSRNVALRGRDRAGLPGDAFYAEVRPTIGQPSELSTGRALILIDTSLSSEEGGAHALRAKLIEALLAKDPSIQKYAVALFDVRTRWLHSVGWRENTREHRAETVDELRRVYLEGATNFAGVLEELERQRAWAVDGGPTTAFLFSDGEITWGLDRLEGLAARYPVLRDVRWVTYRFGDLPANQALFDFLSNESKGRTVTVLSEAEIDPAASAHRFFASELASVKVNGAVASDVFVAGDTKLVFPGQTLRIAGRLPRGGQATLKVAIRTGSALDTIDISLGDSSREDAFAPRAFAELYTNRLIALDDERLDRMVVALSQHYRLANARASFLVLDREEQAKEYKIEDERVDLAKLDELRRKEEDQRRDRLLGIALDDVGASGRQAIDVLRKKSDGRWSPLRPQPLIDAPFAGDEGRIKAEAEYRLARPKAKLDYLLYDRIARIRALSGDTAGAIRALSSAVEVQPRDGEAMRLVGYALLALAQYRAATELFERLRLLRPFEGESYLEEALALDALGRFDQAARNYEIVLAKHWPRHDRELKVTGAYHYARLLAQGLAWSGLSDAERGALSKRLAELESIDGDVRLGGGIDMQLTTFWSTDCVDIDLWVIEPNGEQCDYTHKETSLGGQLHWDVTDGLGPELYHARHAHAGSYDTLVHFYGSRAPRMSAPTAMLMVDDRDLDPFARPALAGSRKFYMRVLPAKDAVLMMLTSAFAPDRR